MFISENNNTSTKKAINYKNRGMALESLINSANEYYLLSNLAVIYKKPTPIGIINTNYNGQKITRGYFKSKSTFDYNGIYRGKYIEFEAKESHNKTSYPLSNIKEHQLNHLKRVLYHGAIVFIIVSINGNFYLLDGEILLNFIRENTRKSIPYAFFEENCHKILKGTNDILDYLKIVDLIYFKGELK